MAKNRNGRIVNYLKLHPTLTWLGMKALRLSIFIISVLYFFFIFIPFMLNASRTFGTILADAKNSTDSNLAEKITNEAKPYFYYSMPFTFWLFWSAFLGTFADNLRMKFMDLIRRNSLQDSLISAYRDAKDKAEHDILQITSIRILLADLLAVMTEEEIKVSRLSLDIHVDNESEQQPLLVSSAKSLIEISSSASDESEQQPQSSSPNHIIDMLTSRANQMSRLKLDQWIKELKNTALRIIKSLWKHWRRETFEYTERDPNSLGQADEERLYAIKKELNEREDKIRNSQAKLATIYKLLKTHLKNDPDNSANEIKPLKLSISKKEIKRIKLETNIVEAKERLRNELLHKRYHTMVTHGLLSIFTEKKVIQDDDKIFWDPNYKRRNSIRYQPPSNYKTMH